MIMNWTLKDMPDLAGKTAIVTGGNSGIGYNTALELARKGATVVIATRDKARGEAAANRIRSVHAAAKVETGVLDLSDLSSVKAFSKRFLAGHPVLDILVNNAGVISLPKREITRDGFEMQVGINHLGHFALTARMLPALMASKGARCPPFTQQHPLKHRPAHSMLLHFSKGKAGASARKNLSGFLKTGSLQENCGTSRKG